MTSVHDKLKPCPKSPNCVSTIEDSAKKRMAPLSYKGDLATTKALLKNLVATMKRTELIEEEEQYLHFTFVTAIGRFTDDVAFYFDEKEQLIHFRSASRVGWSDIGVNKRRMKKIGKMWKGF